MDYWLIRLTVLNVFIVFWLVNMYNKCKTKKHAAIEKAVEKQIKKKKKKEEEEEEEEVKKEERKKKMMKG